MRSRPTNVLCSMVAMLSMAAVASTASYVFAADCGDTTGPGGSRVACSCGDTVTSDTALQGTDPVVDAMCAAVGLLVLADDIQLDCNGKTLSSDSILTSEQGYGILIAGSNATVRECHVTGLDYGIALIDSDSSRVLHSRASNNGIGLQLRGLRNGMIMDNDLSDNSQWGVEGFSGFEGLFEGNLLRDNLADRNGWGGMFQDGTDNQFRGNQMRNNGIWGLAIAAGSENVVDDNDCSQNGDIGLLLQLSTDSIVSDNELHGNARWGLLMDDSTGNIIVDNEADHNGEYGIEDPLAVGNVYSGNECEGNVLGPSNPLGLCEAGDDEDDDESDDDDSDDDDSDDDDENDAGWRSDVERKLGVSSVR